MSRGPMPKVNIQNIVLTASLLLDLRDLLVPQEKRRFIAHGDLVFVRRSDRFV